MFRVLLGYIKFLLHNNISDEKELCLLNLYLTVNYIKKMHLNLLNWVLILLWPGKQEIIPVFGILT